MSNDKVEATFHPGKKPKSGRYQPTPAQVIMRDEMTRSPEEEEGIVAIGRAFDETFGEQSIDRDAEVLALQVISSGPTLHLSLSQWAVVQSLLESGIRLGYEQAKAELSRPS